ncbi:MAG: C40 family peptidase [Tissierellia bacterium]|nr:C40 family peptidase [Tissierellia bacterium]
MNQKLKLSLQACALAAIAVVGLRDTGVFVQDHTTTLYSGKQLSFTVEEKANIIATNNKGYIIQKGEAKVTVPKEKVLVTEGPKREYKVTKNVSLKKDGKVVRNLFLGEVLTMKKTWPSTIEVWTDDDLYGSVTLDSVEAIDSYFFTPAKVTVDLLLENEHGPYELAKDDEVKVVDFQDGMYVIIKDDEFLYAVDPVYLDLTEFGPKVLKTEATQAQAAVQAPAKDKAAAPVVAAPKVNGEHAQYVLNEAYDRMGIPYVWGGTTRDGYDCSGFIYDIYVNGLGYELPRTSQAQSTTGTQVAKEDLQAGDLVFFNTSGSGVSHVGIYIGDGDFIHASTSSGVKVSNLAEGYYSDRYVNGTRVLY